MKTVTKTLNIKTNYKDEMIDITSQIDDIVRSSAILNGLVLLFVPHTTAAITINENADPDVKRDILLGLNKTFPNDKDYAHYEGNSDAHIKSSLVGVDQTILLDKNRLLLGTWQGIYFCEFDGPRSRKLYIRIMGE